MGTTFSSYFKEMPWLALPFTNRKAKDALSKQFGVRGIPTLVLLDEYASLISTNGRALIMEPENFPWTPAAAPLASEPAKLPNSGPAKMQIGGGLARLVGSELLAIDGISNIKLEAVLK